MTVDKIVTQKEQLEIVGATLLSLEEAETLPLRLRKHTNWWWLRSPGYYSYFVAFISGMGSINYHGTNVYYKDGAVRTALKIKNLNSSSLKIGDRFIFGNKTFEIISENRAFCLEDIGEQRFRKDDTNDYEQSDIKKFIDEWFENANKEK